MDYSLWLQLVLQLGSAYAVSQGKDGRALGYLRLVTNVKEGQRLTDEEMVSLKAEFEAKVAGAVPTTPEELSDLDARLAARSAGIQNA